MALITEIDLRKQSVKGLPNPFPLADGDMLTPAAIDFLRSRGIVTCRRSDVHLIPVGVSNRHIHLSPEHVQQLFGVSYTLQPLRELTQKGQYAAQETLQVIGPKGSIRQVRILGPARGATQVEISATDGYMLGIHPPVKLSGDHNGTPGITLSGPAGTIDLQAGLIIAKNHVHMSGDDAKRFEVEHGDSIIVQAEGIRNVIFADVIVRVDDRFSLDFHIDTDEANAAGLKTGDTVRMIGKNGVITVQHQGRR